VVAGAGLALPVFHTFLLLRLLISFGSDSIGTGTGTCSVSNTMYKRGSAGIYIGTGPSTGTETDTFLNNLTPLCKLIVNQR
jgi:hypothetical protein